MLVLSLQMPLDIEQAVLKCYACGQVTFVDMDEEKVCQACTPFFAIWLWENSRLVDMVTGAWLGGEKWMLVGYEDVDALCGVRKVPAQLRNILHAHFAKLNPLPVQLVPKGKEMVYNDFGPALDALVVKGDSVYKLERHATIRKGSSVHFKGHFIGAASETVTPGQMVRVDIAGSPQETLAKVFG